jgi:hypothetical protein
VKRTNADRQIKSEKRPVLRVLMFCIDGWNLIFSPDFIQVLSIKVKNLNSLRDVSRKKQQIFSKIHSEHLTSGGGDSIT